MSMHMRENLHKTRIRHDKKCCVFVGSCIITAPKLDAIEERKKVFAYPIIVLSWCKISTNVLIKMEKKVKTFTVKLHRIARARFVTEKQKTKNVRSHEMWVIGHFSLRLSLNFPATIDISSDKSKLQRCRAIITACSLEQSVRKNMKFTDSLTEIGRKRLTNSLSMTTWKLFSHQEPKNIMWSINIKYCSWYIIHVTVFVYKTTCMKWQCSDVDRERRQLL